MSYREPKQERKILSLKRDARHKASDLALQGYSSAKIQKSLNKSGFEGILSEQDIDLIIAKNKMAGMIVRKHKSSKWPKIIGMSIITWGVLGMLGIDQ